MKQPINVDLGLTSEEPPKQSRPIIGGLGGLGGLTFKQALKLARKERAQAEARKERIKNG